jgi:hypothetical protein
MAEFGRTVIRDVSGIPPYGKAVGTLLDGVKLYKWADGSAGLQLIFDPTTLILLNIADEIEVFEDELPSEVRYPELELVDLVGTDAGESRA